MSIEIWGARIVTMRNQTDFTVTNSYYGKGFSFTKGRDNQCGYLSINRAKQNRQSTRSVRVGDPFRVIVLIFGTDLLSEQLNLSFRDIDPWTSCATTYHWRSLLVELRVIGRFVHLCVGCLCCKPDEEARLVRYRNVFLFMFLHWSDGPVATTCLGQCVRSKPENALNHPDLKGSVANFGLNGELCASAGAKGLRYERFQGTPLRRRDRPLGGALVLPIPDQLPRS